MFGDGIADNRGIMGGAGAGEKESAWKLGLSYKFGALTTNFAYDIKTSDNFGAALGGATGVNLWGHNAYYLSGKYSFGEN